MSPLKGWNELAPAGAIDAGHCPAAGDRRLADRAQARGRPLAVRQLPALLDLLPRLRRSPRWHDLHGLRPLALQGLRDLRRGLPDRRDRDGSGGGANEHAELELLTGGEAVAQAMRQIDPDVVPVYPITPQTPIIQGFAKLAADGKAHTRARQCGVRALRDERGHRLRARRRADDDRHELAGTRADGRGRLHRRLDACPDRDGARQPRTVRPDQHPLRPLGLDADPRLRRDPALRRERAGGVRPDGARAAACRAPGRAPAGARLPGRLHDHPLGRARVELSPTTRSPRFVGEYRVPHPLLDPADPTTQGPFAMPDYYFELRRQQIDALEAALDALRASSRRVRRA